MLSLWDDMKLIAIAGMLLFGTLGITTLAIGGLLVGGNIHSRYQCNNYETVTGIETRYIEWDTCYISTESGWQRWDEYIARAAASEGLSAIKGEGK